MSCSSGTSRACAVLDRGPHPSRSGARGPDQLHPIGEIGGWHVGAETKRDIDAILEHSHASTACDLFSHSAAWKAVWRPSRNSSTTLLQNAALTQHPGAHPASGSLSSSLSSVIG